jgi:DNA-directed RNA polymerase specialized sigma24 family protein
MEPIITEQIEKFQSGDFSGYESFYYATSQTVYTMLHTIIPDENTAAELMPKVYEKIYANVQTLPQTEAFYAWSAKLANEEALEYLKGNAVSTGNSDMQPEMDSVNVQPVESADSSLDMPFYDYAAEDEALAITEDLSEDRVFTEHVQAVIEALSPMEKIVFQSYYYFGESVPMIVEKTGCTTRAVKHTIGQTRTALLSAITAYGQAPTYEVKQENSHKFSLKDTPWLYILFQNYIGKVTGIAHVGITGSAAGAIAMVGQAGGVAGTSAVIGQAGGIAGTAAGQAGSAAGAAVTGQAGGAAGTAAKASAKGSAKFLGTVGGKVAVGVAGVAAVVGIGLGIHHASSEPEKHIVAIEEEDGSGALMWEDGPAPVQEATTEEVSWVDLKLEETRQNVDSYRTTGSGTRGDDAEVGESLAPYERKNCFYAVADINGDGMEDIYFGYWNSETRQVEIRHTYERDDIDGIVTYYQRDLYLSDQAKDFLYDKVDSQFELISDYMDNESSGGVGYLKIDTGGGEKYYKVIATTWYVYGGSDGTVNYDNYDYDFLLRQMRDENYSGYYQEVSASEFETYKASFTYKKLEWHPLFENETILNEDPSIPDADGKF